MGVEIERKFLVKNDNWKTAIEKEFNIKQGYLNSHPERTVRIRIKNNKGILTIKGKSIGASRPEYEYEIPLKDAEALIQLCEQPIIEKTRYIVMEQGKQWEVDVFDGDNKGLVVAEIELDREDEQFALPEWADEEVTQDVRYYNSSLIKLPFCRW